MANSTHLSDTILRSLEFKAEDGSSVVNLVSRYVLRGYIRIQTKEFIGFVLVVLERNHLVPDGEAFAFDSLDNWLEQ